MNADVNPSNVMKIKYFVMNLKYQFFIFNLI